MRYMRMVQVLVRVYACVGCSILGGQGSSSNVKGVMQVSADINGAMQVCINIIEKLSDVILEEARLCTEVIENLLARLVGVQLEAASIRNCHLVRAWGRREKEVKVGERKGG
jgi:hypothetical protein